MAVQGGEEGRGDALLVGGRQIRSGLRSRSDFWAGGVFGTRHPLQDLQT